MDCDDGAVKEFTQRLSELSQLSWNQINATTRKGFGSELIPKDQITAPLPAARVTADVEKLRSFRFGGRARLLGHRDGRVFEVYLIDPGGKSYEH